VPQATVARPQTDAPYPVGLEYTIAVVTCVFW
jgi:hypothetical protein